MSGARVCIYNRITVYHQNVGIRLFDSGTAVPVELYFIRHERIVRSCVFIRSTMTVAQFLASPKGNDWRFTILIVLNIHAQKCIVVVARPSRAKIHYDISRKFIARYIVSCGLYEQHCLAAWSFEHYAYAIPTYSRNLQWTKYTGYGDRRIYFYSVRYSHSTKLFSPAKANVFIRFYT